MNLNDFREKLVALVRATDQQLEDSAEYWEDDGVCFKQENITACPVSLSGVTVNALLDLEELLPDHSTELEHTSCAEDLDRELQKIFADAKAYRELQKATVDRVVERICGKPS